MSVSQFGANNSIKVLGRPQGMYRGRFISLKQMVEVCEHCRAFSGRDNRLKW